MPVNQVLDERYVDREALLKKLLDKFGRGNFATEDTGEQLVITVPYKLTRDEIKSLRPKTNSAGPRP